ncbi:hypothetical protein CEXT_508451 [Caerostris extrusa]|uniref:Uncharacterized protein n=1 Tax=Caerostris extrusa TaxID=172846 RepID=A0AAV4WL48_CAEEX|nr:hypothetical protein CEXT_508451 [Caerostris extrusa]
MSENGHQSNRAAEIVTNNLHSAYKSNSSIDSRSSSEKFGGARQINSFSNKSSGSFQIAENGTISVCSKTKNSDKQQDDSEKSAQVKIDPILENNSRQTASANYPSKVDCIRKNHKQDRYSNNQQKEASNFISGSNQCNPEEKNNLESHSYKHEADIFSTKLKIDGLKPDTTDKAVQNTESRIKSEYATYNEQSERSALYGNSNFLGKERYRKSWKDRKRTDYSTSSGLSKELNKLNDHGCQTSIVNMQETPSSLKKVIADGDKNIVVSTQILKDNDMKSEKKDFKTSIKSNLIENDCQSSYIADRPNRTDSKNLPDATKFQTNKLISDIDKKSVKLCRAE